MVPHPSSIVSIAELQRLDLLRVADSERLAAPGACRFPRLRVSPALKQFVVRGIQLVFAGARLQPRPRVWRLA